MRVFEENQKFNNILFISIMVATIGLVGYLSYQSYQNMPEDSTELLILILSDIFTFVIIAAVFMLKLKTKINEQGVFYGFWPFQLALKHIQWSAIKNIYVREYSPIKEYGGWGYRLSFSKHGKAYNVSGTTGIQIEFTNGKKTLIGTQKKEEAIAVLKTYKHKLKLYTDEI